MLGLSLLMLTTSSCNMVGEAPIPDQDVYDLSKLKGSCNLNAERFKKILDEDISKDIDCLKSNFNQFIDFVKLDDPNVIAQHELLKFVHRFFPKERDRLNKSLFMLFDLNMMILRDQKGKISKANLEDLFNIFRIINNHGRRMKNIFDEGENNYWKNRNLIFESISAISKSILGPMIQRSADGQQIEIMNFIMKVKEASDISDNQLNLKLVESFLFIKKLLAGGDKDIIYTEELESIIKKLPDLAIGILDVMHSTKEILPSFNERDKNFLRGILIISDSLYPLNNDDVIITKSEMFHAVNQIEIKDFNIYHIEQSINNFKKKVLKTDPETFTINDVRMMLGWAHDVFEMFYFNDYTYDKLRVELQSDGPITTLIKPDYSSLKLIREEQIGFLWSNFYDIVKKYRFFQRESRHQSYTPGHERTKYGINNISAVRWGLNKMMDVYGKDYRDADLNFDDQDNLDSGLISSKRAKIPEVRNMLKDYQTMMEEFGLWPTFLERFLGEAVYSSDLFQTSSNGDEKIDVNEATEYVSNIFSSAEYGVDVIDGLSRYCAPTAPYEKPEDRTYDIYCFRKNFYKVFFEDLNYKKEFPGLYNYVKTQSQEEADNFVIAVEKYAREIFDINRPINKVDLGRFFVSLSNIDGFILKYDKNGTNQLERDELDVAFNVFKRTLITFAHLSTSELIFTHSIFLYLVKYMKTPPDGLKGSIEIARFHFFSNKKKIIAERLNIGTILAFFVAI